MAQEYKITLIVKQAAVQPFADALDEMAVAIAAFEIVPGGDWRVEAYAIEEPDAVIVETALKAAGDAHGLTVPKFEIEALPQTDWLAENRRAFPAQTIGRFFIHGSHFEGLAPSGSIPLLLDAATAFGSGEHETTRGCLIAIDRIGKVRRPKKPLDVGCGSGILALAMAKRYRRKVIASDLDRESVRVARENMRLNREAGWVRVEQGAGYRLPIIGRNKPFDLIVANILARPLCQLSKDLKRHLSKDGTVILSGLLENQETMVLAAHRRQGLRLVNRQRRKGWSTLTLAARRA
ncbi:ribosomal protein L11 methyltransferase [Elstera cyanobacteriorum]|uniref:Ribosomal protein L11 methyltransferase n=1 Tax=Elstera cyanobacteriorum TaxID=2022747 RepID=A0A255XTQ4_9PROT|nr:50S ribosomal protein L11 methyltransferase [Elstera cyanobacteriorum]OYQ19744.1 hypothetical protein CHR90_06375 [Elstera cyanobacteriorum]GFZ95356.1 ribosomal protein L11 methyltransferase [Elstera cyanobacteriorum]